MIVKDCPACKHHQCFYAAQFENLLFCFSKIVGDVSFVLDEDIYYFTLSRTSLNLLKNNIILVCFNINTKNTISFFNEFAVDKNILKSFINDIFNEIDYKWDKQNRLSLFFEHGIEIKEDE